MDARTLLEKLAALGVSSDIVTSLQSKIDDAFLTDINTLGLREAAQKVGVDLSVLPDGVLDKIKDGMIDAIDADGDGKVEMSDVAALAQEHIMPHLDTDGDGKVEVSDITAKGTEMFEATTESILPSEGSSSESSLASSQDAGNSSTEDVLASAQQAVSDAPQSSQTQEQEEGFFAKIKKFFSA